VTPDDIAAWEPSGSLVDDLADLARFHQLAKACADVIAEWGPQFAPAMSEKRTGPATIDTPHGPVTRKWQSAGWEWDTASDVLDAIGDEIGIPEHARKPLVDILPAKVYWRLGDADDPEKPGMRDYGIDPDDLELRRKKDGAGRWTLDFSAARQS
jgi:hypothetical protein